MVVAHTITFTELKRISNLKSPNKVLVRNSFKNTFSKFLGEAIGSEIYLGGTLTLIGLLLITLNKNK